MSIDIAVVPVAGHGTRLLPATKSQPKEMLPVGRKPVVQYVAEELVNSGIRRLLFVTGARKVSIENHFDEDSALVEYLRSTGREEELATLGFSQTPVEYFYTRQRRQLGLGHAILCAKSLVGNQPFVVALGDSILGVHGRSRVVAEMLAEYQQSQPDLVVAVEEVPRPQVRKYGIIDPGQIQGNRIEIRRLIEKPTVEEAPSNLAIAGRYILNPRVFEELSRTPPGRGGEIQLTDAMQSVLESGGRGVAILIPSEERRYDIGNFGSYFRSFVEFALNDPEYGESLRAHLRGLLDVEVVTPPNPGSPRPD